MGVPRVHFWALVIVLLPALSLAWPEDYMWCRVGTSGNSKILGLSGITNAHAELPSFSNYMYGIFCELNGTMASGQAVLRLSNQTNAHLEMDTFSNYNFPAEIGYQHGNVYCRYGSCAWYESCLVSISNNTNAHAESCDEGNYQHSLCCYAVDTETPEIGFTSPTPPDSTHSNSSFSVGLDINETSYRLVTVVVEPADVMFLRFESMGSTTPDFFSGSADVRGSVTQEFGVFGKSANLTGGNISAYRDYNGTELFVSAWYRGSDGNIMKGENWILNTSGFYIYNGTWFSVPFPASDGKWHLYAGYWNGSSIFSYFDGAEYQSAAGPGEWMDFSGNITVNAYGLVDNAIVATIPMNTTYMNKTLSGTYSGDVNPRSDGNYFFYGYVEDMSGNYNTTEKRKYTYDTTPPFVRIDEPANNSYVELGIWINTTVYDILSPLQYVRLYINDTLLGENTTTNPSFFWNTSLYKNGPYNFTLKACDIAGNCNQTGTYVFIVNNSITVTTAAEHEIDVNGTSTSIIWATAIRNDGTPETSGTAEAFINFTPSSSYQMQWSSQQSRWEYEANATTLGLGVGDHNYSVLVNNSNLDIHGWGLGSIHVDDLVLKIHNLSQYYYSLDKIVVYIETRRKSNNALETATANATLKGQSVIDSGTCVGDNCSIELDAGCFNTDTMATLEASSNTSYLIGNANGTTTIRPRPMELECGFEPSFLNWDYSQTNITYWCRITDTPNSTYIRVDSLNVSITDSDPSYSNDCEGDYNISDFSWNPSLERYELNCTLTASSVPDNCFDLTAMANATKDCYGNATNQTTGTINCPPSCGSSLIRPLYIDVNRTSEKFELSVNVTDYDGYGDVSVVGRKQGGSYQQMTRTTILGQFNATFTLDIGHESSVACFYGDIVATDPGGLSCSSQSNTACGEDLSMSFKDGCNRTIYWGESAEINATALFATDSANAQGNATCYLYNNTRVSDVTVQFDRNISCTITPPRTFQEVNYTVGINATSVRDSVIDGNLTTGCWLYVKLRKINVNCSYPDRIDYSSPLDIECNVTDSLGDPVSDATMDFTSSGKCTPVQPWTYEGGGNYSYSCIPEVPGDFRFNVTATSTGYSVGNYSGLVYVRYVERQEVVDLVWEGFTPVTYPDIPGKLISFSRLEYPFACISDNFTTGVISLGRSNFIRKTPLVVQQKEVGNMFVVPITDAPCDSIAKKTKSFLEKGDITSPLSDMPGGISYYYVIVRSPVGILNDTTVSGRFALERDEDGIRVIR